MNDPAAKILAFLGDDYEDLEIWYPKLRFEEAGFACVLAGLDGPGTKYHGKHGYPATSDVQIRTVRSADFAGLLVAGGWMPDKLRRDADVLRLTREFDQAGKLIATICHGPWILISAGICRGRRLTSTPGIRDDVANAGAAWNDVEALTDRNIVSARRPPDLPAFMRHALAVLADRQTG